MRSSSPDLGGEMAPLEWRKNLMLFLATVASVFVTGVMSFQTPTAAGAKASGATAALGFLTRDALVSSVQFTASLLTILVAHELGHYVAARIHKVDASLPFFIPMPLLSPFGTMGAVIRMRGTIPTRRALLDIGASGPLAGLCFALPMYFWGAAHSTAIPASGLTEGMVELGDSLALRLMDHFSRAPLPQGMELQLSPMAFAAWAGMFVTMINLLPVGQLDGGHVAYALFGPRQDKLGQTVHRAMLGFFFVLLGSGLVRDARVGFGLHRIGMHVGNALFWLVWFEMLAVLGALSSAHPKTPEPGTLTVRTRLAAMVGLLALASYGREHPAPFLWFAWFVGLGLLLAMEVRGGALRRETTLLDHPPTGSAPLDAWRAAIAIVTLLFFVLLFMPQPISM